MKGLVLSAGLALGLFGFSDNASAQVIVSPGYGYGGYYPRPVYPGYGYGGYRPYHHHYHYYPRSSFSLNYGYPSYGYGYPGFSYPGYGYGGYGYRPGFSFGLTIIR